MKSRLPSACYEFTKKMREDPLACIFIEPAENALPPNLVSEYRSIVKAPMDISTIQQKMKNDAYSNEIKWAQDFQLIFDNAIKYDRNMSYVSGIASYLSKKFEKYYDNVVSKSTSNFVQHLMALYTNYLDILSNPPPNTLKSTQIYPEQLGGVFEESTLQLLADKLNYLPDSDTEELHKILGIDMPNDDSGDIDVELATLPPEKIIQLWQLVRKFTVKPDPGLEKEKEKETKPTDNAQ